MTGKIAQHPRWYFAGRLCARIPVEFTTLILPVLHNAAE